MLTRRQLLGGFAAAPLLTLPRSVRLSNDGPRLTKTLTSRAAEKILNAPIGDWTEEAAVYVGKQLREDCKFRGQFRPVKSMEPQPQYHNGQYSHSIFFEEYSAWFPLHPDGWGTYREVFIQPACLGFIHQLNELAPNTTSVTTAPIYFPLGSIGQCCFSTTRLITNDQTIVVSGHIEKSDRLLSEYVMVLTMMVAYDWIRHRREMPNDLVDMFQRRPMPTVRRNA